MGSSCPWLRSSARAPSPGSRAGARRAGINGFPYDRHAEEQAVEAFARALVMAGEHYLENRLYSPLLPNWNRMVAALPEVMDWLEVLPYEDRKAVMH